MRFTNRIIGLCLALVLSLTGLASNAFADSDALSGFAISDVKIDSDRFHEGLPALELNGLLLINTEQQIEVTAQHKGQLHRFHTGAKTIGDALKERGILPENGDIVFPSLETPVSRVSTASVFHFSENIVAKSESVPFTSTEVESSDHPLGEKTVEVAGVNGTKVQEVKQVVRDGIVIQEQLINENITVAPVQEVIRIGTAAERTAPSETQVNLSGEVTDTSSSSSDMGFSYSRVIEMNATAYDASVSDGVPYTASGTIARPGVIAVDPGVIPLGTRVYVESLDSWPSYGYAVAEDTGSAIVGNIIDLFYDSHQTALDFGRRNVRVYILD